MKVRNQNLGSEPGSRSSAGTGRCKKRSSSSAGSTRLYAVAGDTPENQRKIGEASGMVRRFLGSSSPALNI